MLVVPRPNSWPTCVSKKKKKGLHFFILTVSDDHLSNGAKGEKGNGKVEHLRLRGRD